MARNRYASAGFLTAGAIAGAILAGTVGANAASGGGTSPTPGSAPSGPPPATAMGHGPGETLLTGSDAQKAKSAALDAVSGGTVIRVETDSGDAVYEAHMTKSDGSAVTVKLDKNFNVTAVEDGMGQ